MYFYASIIIRILVHDNVFDSFRSSPNLLFPYKVHRDWGAGIFLYLIKFAIYLSILKGFLKAQTIYPPKSC